MFTIFSHFSAVGTIPWALGWFHLAAGRFLRLRCCLRRLRRRCRRLCLRRRRWGRHRRGGCGRGSRRHGRCGGGAPWVLGMFDSSCLFTKKNELFRNYINIWLEKWLIMTNWYTICFCSCCLFSTGHLEIEEFMLGIRCIKIYIRALQHLLRGSNGGILQLEELSDTWRTPRPEKIAHPVLAVANVNQYDVSKTSCFSEHPSGCTSICTCLIIDIGLALISYP